MMMRCASESKGVRNFQPSCESGFYPELGIRAIAAAFRCQKFCAATAENHVTGPWGVRYGVPGKGKCFLFLLNGYVDRSNYQKFVND